MTVPTQKAFQDVPKAGVFIDTNYDAWMKTDTTAAVRLSDATIVTTFSTGAMYLYFPDASLSL